MYIAISTIILLIIIISAILFYISVRSFYKKDSREIPVEYLQSMNYLLSEQHDKALDTFLSMISVNQDTAETHIILGNLFRNRGESDRAIRIHQNLIARPELKREIRQQCSIELAKDFLKAGFLDRAELIFSKLAKEIDQPIQVLEYLKEIYEKEKDWGKAIEVSKKIQTINNIDMSDVISHYYCELAEFDLTISTKDSFESAKKNISKAINYNKNSLRALILLADLSYLKKDYIEALKKYISILNNYPNFSYMIYEKLKITYEKTGNKNNFLNFVKSFCNAKNPIELFSNLDSNLSLEISNNELIEFYQKGFSKGIISLSQLSEYIELISENKIAFDNQSLNNIKKCLQKYSLKESSHECVNCGYTSVKHCWQCPSCHKWSTITKNLLNQSKNSNYVL